MLCRGQETCSPPCREIFQLEFSTRFSIFFLFSTEFTVLFGVLCQLEWFKGRARLVPSQRDRCCEREPKIVNLGWHWIVIIIITSHEGCYCRRRRCCGPPYQEVWRKEGESIQKKIVPWRLHRCHGSTIKAWQMKIHTQPTCFWEWNRENFLLFTTIVLSLRVSDCFWGMHRIG